MLIDPKEILKAKQALGDRNADIIAELMKVEKYNAQRHTCCCPSPAHDDNTPSCSYNPKTYAYKCFGCGYTFDILDAYMQALDCTFIEACEKLFAEAKLPYDFTEKGILSKSDYRYPKPTYASNKDEVYKYWGSRCISPETIDYLGIEQDPSGNTLFQYWDLNDVLSMVKVRKSRKVAKGENKIWCLPGSDTQFLLYNCSKINPAQPLILCTGEGDCATAVECGFKNAVSVPLGDGNKQWIAENWEWLSQFSSIILVHDNDKSGVEFAKDVTVRLGEYRVKTAIIPKVTTPNKDGVSYKIKDLNELLFFEGKDAVVEVLTNARDAEIPSLVDYTDVEKFDMSDVDGFITGFKDLDAALDKFYVGTTTVLTGIASSGKSSFISTLICRSVEQGFPVFVYSGELSNPSLKNWVDSVHAGQRGINRYEGLSGPYYKIRPEVYNAINNYYKNQIYFYRDGFDQKISTLLSTMESAVRIRGVKTIVIDNMTSVDLENDDNNKWQKQDEFIRALIDFAKKWQVICIVVLHPKKMDFVRRMNIFDLQGVASSVNLSHRVLALYRVPPQEQEGVKKNGKVIEDPIPYDVLIDVLKDRFGSGNNKTIGLYYDNPSRRFFDSYENLDHRYAWDKNDYGDTPLPYGAHQLERENEVLGPPMGLVS